MSNRIRYDTLLVRHLARELNERVRGRRTTVLPTFGPDLSVTLPFDGGEALRFDLHPSRGWVRIVPWTVGDEDLSTPCTDVTSPPDERQIRIRLSDSHRFRGKRRDIVIELLTNQWNAVVTDGERNRIIAVLRARDAAGRRLAVGETYSPPAPQPRIGRHEITREWARTKWFEILEATPPAERARELVREFALTGPINAGPLLGTAVQEGSGTEALAEAFDRWWAIRSLDTPRPVLLRIPSGRHPYPTPLAGVESTPVSSLIDAMDSAAGESPTEPQLPEPGRRLEHAHVRLRRAKRRIDHLTDELRRAGDANRLRGYGDLLLARLHEVPRGASSVILAGWNGDPEEIPLDPGLSPSENAQRWYARARQRARAAERLPGLLRKAEAEFERWRAAIEAGKRGDWPEWALRALEKSVATRDGSSSGGADTRLPYRRFRTSGGLEVRVGRTSRDNDRLTFQHSAPDDVWLHARSVPGSHVILRWPHSDAAPPGRDLAEAAGLAAYFSKARSSGTVAVDWARRKHVRKPRGAAPGSVIPQRVRTLFVQPDAGLARRLRAEDPG